jgi:hypothetical protein
MHVCTSYENYVSESFAKLLISWLIILYNFSFEVNI